MKLHICNWKWSTKKNNKKNQWINKKWNFFAYLKLKNSASCECSFTIICERTRTYDDTASEIVTNRYLINHQKKKIQIN